MNLKLILSLLLFLIFLGLALIHFYWAFGGEYGFARSLPTDKNGVRLFNPSSAGTAFVGIVLLFFGFFYFSLSNAINFSLPNWLLSVTSWIIPILFTLRAIGDFKYVGLFKSIRNTTFGQLDSFFYSPLCLIIGMAGFLIIKLRHP